jgi:PII-like signaling protein
LTEHNAVLMRIFIAEGARGSGGSTFRVLVERLLAHGFDGATVFRGIEGFGESRRLEVDWASGTPGEVPMLIEVASDDLARIRAFLAGIEDVLDDGLVTLERIQRMRRPA